MPETATCFIDSSPLPGFRIDLEGRLCAWNMAAERLTGISAANLVGTDEYWRPFYNAKRPLLCDFLLTGRGWENFVSPAPPERRGEMTWTLANIDKPVAGDVIIFAHAGLLRGKDGRKQGAWQIFQTLSLRHALGCSNAIDMLLSTIPYPLAFVINGLHFRSNQAFASLWEMDTPEEAIGFNAGAFIAPEDRERFSELNDDRHGGLVSGEKYKWKYNVRGKIKYVEGSPRIFSLGNDRILISALKDVTEDVRREEELKKEKNLLEEENRRLLRTINRNFHIFAGRSPAMRRTLDRAAQLSRSDVNLVILGETGCGKSMLARAIHDMSKRSAGPFVAVNCAAIPEQLFESEFFGYMKGAFTGATQQKIGYLAKANGGTLFLDEVGELSQLIQSKLLHAVEWKKFMPLGSNAREQASDVRLVCATNRDLAGMLRDGSMREDFFYRIFVGDIAIPSLREWREDLPGLFDFIMEKYGCELLWKDMPLKIRKMLMAYDWPGNVREFQNVLNRYIVTGELVFVSKNARIQGGHAGDVASPEPMADAMPADMDLRKHMEKVEKDWILRALRACRGRKDKTAQALGLNLRTFQRRCAKLGI